MPPDLRLQKKLQQLQDERLQLLPLFRSACVGRMPVRVQSAFIADADGAAVEGPY